MRYEIKSKKSLSIPVSLEHYDDVVLIVGDWNVLGLTPEGVIEFYGGISKNNVEGLDVDDFGKVKIK